MKKLTLLLTAILLSVSACDNSNSQAQANNNITKQSEIQDNKIYFFYSTGCPHCHDALAYINQKYPDLKLSMVNVSNRDGYNLFIKCAKKFNLGNQIGTPLFCMGNKYIMGWSDEYAKKFDNDVKPFIK